MFRKKELQKYNEQIHSEMKNKSFDFVHMGFFNNNHILFVGQNPGNPYDETTKNKVNEIESANDFKIKEQKYQELLKATKITRYINSLVGKSWNHISFTNFVKCPTKNNEAPTQELFDMFNPILKKQIELIQPNIVILLGSKVAEQFKMSHNELKKIDNIWYYSSRHPSYLEYTNTFVEYIESLKNRLNNFFKQNAIIKVNIKNVYYRDLEFKKQMYFHSHIANFMFIEDENGDDGETYKGKNVRKVNKYEFIDDSVDTYEAHLNSKNLFYYDNIDTIQHSKIIKYTTLDIETNMCNDILKPDIIISIGAVNNIDNEYKMWLLDEKNKHIENVRVFTDERDMIIDFLENIYDSDALIGWYSNGFDVPYIINRARLLGININKYFHNLFIRINENKEVTSLNCDNISFVDALEAYKKFVYYNKPKSFSLDNVAELVLNEKKIKIGDIRDIYLTDKKKLIKYNKKDVELCYRIIQKMELIDYGLRIQQICPQDFTDFQWNSKIIENLLHHRYWKKRIYFPTKKEHVKLNYKGAIVLDSVAGLYENAVVYDFSAMYTSIYISFNYSPDTILDSPIKNSINVDTDIGKFSFVPNNIKMGILPSLELEMLENRKKFQEERDKYIPNSPEYKIQDDLQGMFKTILNSIYGVAAYKKFILFDTRIPASITSTARQLLKFVEEISNEIGYKVLYGDTDSIFISIPGNTREEVLANGKKFEKIVNNRFSEFISRFTKDENTIKNHILKFDLEKIYSKLLLTNVKKRYFGKVKYYKGKFSKEDYLIVTGFETRRDDTPSFFKKSLSKIYEVILDNNIEKLKILCNNIKGELHEQDIEDLVIRIKLAKNEKEYKNLPIHLKALRNSGEKINRGDKVQMIYITGSQKVTHYVEGKEYDIDYERYYEKFIEDKIKLINEDIHKKLFDEQNELTKWF